MLEELELHIRLNEDDWSRNPQAQFKRFAEVINANQLNTVKQLTVIDVNSVTQVPELKELLDAQRKVLHDRLNESLRFEDESERSDFVLDIMSDLPYPYCENFIPWISVDDKLPPEEEDVFVYAKSDVFVYYGVGYLCDGTWMDGEFAKINDHEVTHWMPLIEPKLK